MKISKFIIPTITLAVGTVAGAVFGYKNHDRIKEAVEAGRDAAREKLEQLKEAAEEVEKEAKEGAEDAKKEAEEVAGKVAEAAAEVVDGNFQPQAQPQVKEQPRGKDGRFVKS